MRNENEHWGLNALGVAAPFEVSLHEGIGRNAWELELSCGVTTIAFHLNSPKQVALILAFLSENYGKTKSRRANEGEVPGIPAGSRLFSEVASMKFQIPGKVEVLVSKDGELPDRFHFSVLAKGFRFHADLHDPETSKLITALRQVTVEMTNG